MLPTLLLSAFAWAVPAPTGTDFYTLFYVLAFALNLGLLVREGHRRGYPLRSWLVLLACTTLAFILGTKLLAFTPAEWQQFLRSGHWPDSEARTVLGGALAGTLTLLALRRRFGFSWHVFDAFTLPMCAALVVQCVGCVLTGCCFGEVTAGGWGLTYAPGTLPYLVQWNQGLIPDGAAHSLPVHPTQLYSLLLCAGVGAVLVLTRRRPWPGGSRRLLHLGLLLAGRFLIEFWRHPAGEQVGAALRTHGGLPLKQVQWALLLLVPVVLGAWVLLLRRARRHALVPELIPGLNSRLNLLAVAALLALTAWLGPLALTLPEVLVIKTLLLTVLVLEAGALFRTWATTARPGRVALPLGLACTVLVLTSQAPADSARQTLEVSLGAGNGAFHEDVSNGGGGGCSGRQTRDLYDHRYSLRGGNVEMQTHDNSRTTVGLGVWQGEDRVIHQSLDPFTGELKFRTDSVKQLLGFNPYFRMSSRLRPNHLGFGLRAGFQLGQLTAYGRKETTFTSGANLDLGMWLGIREKVFFQADVNPGMQGVGSYTSRLALGSGLGQLDASSVLVGAAFARHQPSYGMGFVSADIRLGGTGLWLYPYGATDFGRHHQLNMRLGYRIPVGRK